MRRNKINVGWDSVVREKKRFQKSKISWTLKYEYNHLKENTIFSKIVKFIIRISLLFAFYDKNFTKIKRKTTINYTYNVLASPSFKFIPSSVAFYLFLAVIPIFTIVMSTISFIDENWYNFLIEDKGPLSQLIPGINKMFERTDFKAVHYLFLAFFLLSSIWFASKGINKFRDSYTELYGYDNKDNFFIKRIKSIFLVVFISIYFIIFSICYVPLMKLLSETYSHEVYLIWFYFVTFIYFFIFGYVGLWLLFRYISPIRIKLRYLNLGILTSLIPILIFLMLFSTICKYLNYEKFGAIGSFLYLLLFILYISYFLHAGIIINSSYYKTTVFANVVVQRYNIGKKIMIVLKNIYYRFKFYRRN